MATKDARQTKSLGNIRRKPTIRLAELLRDAEADNIRFEPNGPGEVVARHYPGQCTGNPLADAKAAATIAEWDEEAPHTSLRIQFNPASLMVTGFIFSDPDNTWKVRLGDFNSEDFFRAFATSIRVMRFLMNGGAQ